MLVASTFATVVFGTPRPRACVSSLRIPLYACTLLSVLGLLHLTL